MQKEQILQMDRKELYDDYLTYVIGSPQLTLSLVRELEESERYETDYVFRIYVQLSEALACLHLGEGERGLLVANKLMESAVTMEMWEVVSYCHLIIGGISYSQGLYENCYEHYNKVLINEELHGISKLKPSAHCNIALVHMRLDDIEGAAFRLKKALDTLEENKDTDPRYHYRKTWIMSMYFPILCELNRIDEMIPFMEEMENSFNTHDNIHNSYQYNLAMMYYHFTGGNFDLAKTYYNKSMELISNDNDNMKFSLHIAFCITSIQYKLDEAFYLDVLMEAYEMNKQKEYSDSAPFLDLAVTFFKQSQREELYLESVQLLAEALKKKILYDKNARLHSFQVLESNLYKVKDYEEVESKNIELKRLAEEAIRHKNEVEEMNKRIKIVHDLGRKLTTSLDIKEVVDLIYKNLKENVPLTTFYIVLSDNKNQLLRSLTYYEWDELRPNFVIPIDSENSVVAECYREGKVITINDLDKDKDYLSKLLIKIGKGATKSAIFTPLIVGDEVVAVCSIQHHVPGVFNESHRLFLEELTPYLAVAINNANKSTELENEISSHKKTQDNLISANARLEMLSAIDGLTQISNRRDFETRVLSMMDDSIQQEKPISIFMFDLDYFKSFNDTYGHLEGDEALKSVARIIRKHLDGVKGLSARFGGEEFIAACLGLGEEESIQLANAIREDLYEENIHHENSPIGRLTISIGVAISMNNVHVVKSDIMRWADISLYNAKNTGKNKAVLKVVVEGEELPSGVATQFSPRKQ